MLHIGAACYRFSAAAAAHPPLPTLTIDIHPPPPPPPPPPPATAQKWAWSLLLLLTLYCTILLLSLYCTVLLLTLYYHSYLYRSGRAVTRRDRAQADYATVEMGGGAVGRSVTAAGNTVRTVL